MGYAAKLGSGGKGKLAVINLGTGTSINCSTHSVLKDYYTELTVDNFYYRPSARSQYNASYECGSYSTNNTINMRAVFYVSSLSYNTSTGVLTRSGNCYATIQFIYSPKTPTMSISSPSINLYCFYLE